MKGKPLYDYCLENPNMMYLLDEWVYDKNECELGYTPYNTSYGSDKKVYWRCFECGKTYIARVNNRIHGRNCSFCKNRKIGESNRRRALDRGSLASCRPDLLEEWDYNKNKISPEEVPVGSQLKVYWKCKTCGHSWRAIVYTRTSDKLSCDCPKCIREQKSSFPEQVIYYYLRKVYKKVINGEKSLLGNNFELDIFIPEIKTAIEYDGVSWHKDVNRDLKKNKLCQEKGIRLIRIRENGLSNIVGSINIFREENSSVASLENVLNSLFLLLNIKININIERDRQEIYSQYIKSVKENSLAVKFPEIAKEWHPTKNGSLTPEHVSYASNKTFVWLCKNGHEWKTTVSSRTEGNGCPYCYGRYVIKGQTDLCSVNPDLALEWDYSKNVGLFPDSVSAGNHTKVWWKCRKCGYEWEAQINSRNRGNGCPECRGEKIGSALVKRGAMNGNDLASNYPNLLKEWDYEKNDILPSNVAKFSEQIVWWKCEKGHSWQSSVINRSRIGSGCPYCSGHTVLTGFNDLATTHPELVKEWHPTKNGSLTPEKVSRGSGKKVWWVCDKGHEFEQSISARALSDNKCPYCSNKKVLVGFNDLASQYPELAKEWNYEKNGDLTPDNVASGSGKKVWWKCSVCGYEYLRYVYTHVLKKGIHCPECAKKNGKS